MNCIDGDHGRGWIINESPEQASHAIASWTSFHGQPCLGLTSPEFSAYK